MGQSKQSVIEVNGKRYDARTGQLIKEPAAAAKKSAQKKPRPIHDFARSGSTANGVHKIVQRSQTLMRTGVRRPAPKAAVKAVKPRQVSDFKPARKNIQPAMLPAKSEAERQARAAAVKQSSLVRKFGDIMRPAGTSSAVPAVQTRVEPMKPVPAPLQHKQAPALKPRSKSESLIEKGLRNASAHKAAEKPKRSKARRKGSKLAAYAAGTMAVLLLAGLVVYQNIPKISVRYAATRAGIAASLPSYSPSGFSLSPKINYTPGHLTLSYESNSDERGFTITQRESNWNSDALISNYVLGASDGEQPQTYEDKGRTIYLFGDSSATWVSNGVWYEIKGNSSKLTSDQLIRIATSL